MLKLTFLVLAKKIQLEEKRPLPIKQKSTFLSFEKKYLELNRANNEKIEIS